MSVKINALSKKLCQGVHQMKNQSILYKTTYIFLPLLFSFCLLLALHAQVTQAVPNAPGDLDTTFGSNGVVIEDIGGFDVGRGIAIRSDNKIWAIADSFNGSFTASQSYLLLYNSNGTLDATFGTAGVALITSINPSANDGVSDIVLQSDGKVVIAGSVDTNGNNDFAVFRFAADGTADNSFGNGGVITTPISISGDDEATSIVVQSDGKIVAAGNVTNNDFALVRYEDTGSLDTTFGNGGVITTNFPIGTSSGVDRAYDVIEQTDGKIVAVGYSAGRFGIARYTSEGEQDSSFGHSGIISTVVGTDPFLSAYAVAEQSDGKLLVSGTGYNDIDGHYAWTLVRYNEDGSLDTSFGTGGIVKTDFGGSSTSYAMQILPNGKIILVGDGSNGSNGLGVTIVQYNADGSLDTSFGSGGVVHTTSGARATEVLVQVDGKLVVSGYATASAPPEELFLARYEGVDLGQTVYLPFVVKP